MSKPKQQRVKIILDKLGGPPPQILDHSTLANNMWQINGISATFILILLIIYLNTGGVNYLRIIYYPLSIIAIWFTAQLIIILRYTFKQ